MAENRALKKVFLVKVPGSATPHRIECDFAFVDNHAMLIFADRCDKPCGPGNELWETVAGYHSGRYEWFRFTGVRWQ